MFFVFLSSVAVFSSTQLLYRRQPTQITSRAGASIADQIIVLCVYINQIICIRACMLLDIITPGAVNET